ncbi:DegT/DnrJ/EryC1/StrS family aminotransferase [Actinoplanes sp. NPDC089786]|uniref:DegT/DnrJ/EryC1/StrS family aminotransferase n=1 Tax=Actinoplanes sp. NPDC089786 TaxID=3155185 RepID=UPI003443E273
MGVKVPAAPHLYAVPYLPIGGIFDDRELAAVREVLTSGATLSQGVWRPRFEEAFRRYTGTRHAFSVTSGTVALHLAIHLLDLRPGDEVIATPQTYQATIQPLLDYQVTVRFADVRPDDANIDPDRVAELINERTRAVLLVHYGGAVAGMTPIMDLARRHGLLVLEDAAHALGSTLDGRRAGSLADIGCFSFHSSKNITTLGEGGMVTFDRDDWAERLERLRSNEADAVLRPARHSFGLSEAPVAGALYPGHAYTHDYVRIRRAGTNATLGEPAAAFGLVQMDRLPDLLARRQAIAGRLGEVLGRFPEVRPQQVAPGSTHAYHLFTFFVDPAAIDRDALIRELGAAGVQTYLRYFPLHLLPEWRARGHGAGECPVAERLWFGEHMNLSCQPGLSDSQVEMLGDALDRSLRKLVR